MCLPPPLDGVRDPYTRYYSFTRINPTPKDYILLATVCRNIDAYWGYRVFRDGLRVRLSGFLVLRGPRTFVDDIERLFPNFLFINMIGSFEYNFDCVNQHNNKIIGPGDHPFDGIKVNLFA